MKKRSSDTISRKKFLKVLGNVATTSAGLVYGCNSNNQTLSNNSDNKATNISTGKMEYRVNPNTGDKVSLLGYGCMRLPMKTNEQDDEIDQEAFNELVDYAIAHGVNYFDTSPAYTGGFSERSLGIALKRYPREKYFIATKMSNFHPDSKTKEASIALYHRSLKELQVDYIDYYLLHALGLGSFAEFNTRFIENGIFDFLLKEREEGRIRNLGWSFHGDVAVFDYLIAMDVKWDFALIQLNYVDWKHASGINVNAEYLYKQLAKHGVPVMIMEPLLGGRLAKLNYDSSQMLKQQQPGASVASWAFRFAGALPNVLTVLSGMTYKEHLVDNLRTYSSLNPLNDKEKAMLEEVAQMILKYPLIFCTECDYCMPCPYGVDIPNIFAHFNRCITEGNFPKDLQDENYRKARRAFLIGYDRSVPKLRQANHCIGCEKCIPTCPQRLNIPNEMARIDKFVEELKQSAATI